MAISSTTLNRRGLSLFWIWRARLMASIALSPL